jgi:membrane-bound lytic murein transglycosylase D
MADAASDNSRPTRPHSPASLFQDLDERHGPNSKVSFSAAMNRLDQLRPVVEPILQSEGIPVALSSVVVVESGGRPNALSPKGALGLWQLMPDTGRRYGLVVDSLRDDRLDVEKSTRAAARYLSDLYEQFGSWPLALAAYNAGEQVLQKAVNRGGSSNFFQLSDLRLLPQETRNYVPEVLSVMRLHGSQQLPEGATATRSSDSSELVFAVPKIRP